LPGGTVYLIEKSNQVARGIAYGTDRDCHLLNVRAKGISAFPEEPDHFVKWLSAHGYGIGDVGSQFASRKLFGVYLAEILEEARASSNASLEIVNDEATSLCKSGDQLLIGFNGKEIVVEHAVLALGNLPPRWPATLAPLAADPRFIAQPWSSSTYEKIGKEDRVLLIGTGLTMIDVVLSLQQQSHTGPIFARSRRGLLPTSHAQNAAGQVEFEAGDGLIGRVITKIRESGDDWREVVDALRPRTAELWQTLSWRERDRFRKRLQIYWDVHRHRMPEQVAADIADLMSSGQLSVGKGQLSFVLANKEGVIVEFKTQEGSEKLAVDWVINCTGPSGDLATAKVPLLESGVQAGLVEYDPLGAGLLVDKDGRANEKANVWAVGSLCRGCWLETTAIPEIRTQAIIVANAIAIT
jgi:uncharacterized NAD(P)/FAD-binding protein YdhS